MAAFKGETHIRRATVSQHRRAQPATLAGLDRPYA